MFPHPGHPPNPIIRWLALILYLSVDLEELSSLGKAFRWSRPRRCFGCSSTRVWGHGYVLRYFDELVEGVWLKRWRCDDCRCVYTMRPHEYWRRFRARYTAIVESIQAKASGKPFLPTVVRQRQQYWWRGFIRQQHIEGIGTSLERLLGEGIVAATHSLSDRGIRPTAEDTYPILAVTATARSP